MGRAVRARPNCPWAYALKGAVLNYSGDHSSAIDLARLAIRHSPITPPIFAELLAASHYLYGLHEEAVVAARGTIEAEPDNLEAHTFLAAALLALGRTGEAQPVLEAIQRLRPGFTLDGFVRDQPYKDPSTLSNLLADLRTAGLP